MLSTKTKPKTAVPDFATAKARWAEIDAKHRDLIERRDGIQLALSFSKSGLDKRTPEALVAKARPFLDQARGRPRTLARQLTKLEDEIEDLTTKVQVELELWQAARRQETGRIARDLQPRHRAAIKEIAKAVEALSRAMTEELDTRAELARTAPEQTSAYLPNCIGGLVIGTLVDWNSPASEWARAMRELKILE